SWLLRQIITGYELVALVDYRYTEIKQELVDGWLALRNQLVQLSFPVLIGRANTHDDTIVEMRAAFFFQKQCCLHPGGGMRGVVPSQRPPQHPRIDLTGVDVIHHCLCRGIVSCIHDQWVWLGIRYETVSHQVTCRWGAGND